jgi:GSCFA family
MEFRTELHLSEKYPEISYQTPILSLGSCFADRIGTKLQENKFNTLVNPFGVIFNPISLFKHFEYVFSDSGQTIFSEKKQVQNPDGIWQHYDFHSKMGNSDKEIFQQNIFSQIQKTHFFLQKQPFCLFTFGTAFVYQHIENNEIVANCHKMPQKYFQKKMLTLEEITNSFDKIAHLFQNQKILLTVSPVRHLKDTLPLNSVSKAILRLACHYLQEKYENVYYFPSYEFTLDDLRDYRFYKPDMLHPTEQAEQYIWQKLTQACMSADTQATMQAWKNIQKSLGHHIFQENTPSAILFFKKLLENLKKLSTQIDVGQEIEKLEEIIKINAKINI